MDVFPIELPVELPVTEKGWSFDTERRHCNRLPRVLSKNDDETTDGEAKMMTMMLEQRTLSNFAKNWQRCWDSRMKKMRLKKLRVMNL